MVSRNRLRLRNPRLQGGVSQNVMGGMPMDAKRFAITPGMVAAVANTGGTIAETIGGGEQVADVDVDQARRDIDKGYDDAQGELDETMTTLGTGRGMSAPGRHESAETALVDYYTKRGFPPEEAAAKATSKMTEIKSGKGKLRDIGGGKFKKFLKRQGSDYGFKVKGGKIGYDEGDFEIEGQRDPLADEQVGLTQDVLETSRGLVPEFGQDAQAGLDYKQRVRELLGQQTVDAGMDGLLAADMEDLQSASQDINRQTFSELQDTGFLSSSIAPKAFADASTKGLRSNLLQMQKNKAGLRSQNIRDILATEQQLGGPSSLGEFQSGSIVSPTQYGGATDVQGAEIGQREAGMRADLEKGRAEAKSRASLTPTYM